MQAPSKTAGRDGDSESDNTGEERNAGPEENVDEQLKSLYLDAESSKDMGEKKGLDEGVFRGDEFEQGDPRSTANTSCYLQVQFNVIFRCNGHLDSGSVIVSFF